MAVDIGNRVRYRLGTTVRRLAQSGAHVKWVPLENLHLSLAFIGDAEQSRIGAIREVLDTAVSEVSAFTFQVHGLGTFGRPKSLRVVWAGVAGGPVLFELQRRVTGGLQRIGFASERREYTPHITLGRVKSGRHKSALLEALKKEEDVSFGKVNADRVLLMQSILKACGAEHYVVNSSNFSNGKT